MDYAKDRITAVQAILATIFSSQKALQTLAPEYRWTGLGNLLGDFGELVATDYYGLTKATPGSGDYDGRTADGKSVQIKTNYSADQIGFRGSADLMLVIGVKPDGSWELIYYGDFANVKAVARYSARDNKHMIAVSKLKALQASATSPATQLDPKAAGPRASSFETITDANSAPDPT